MDDYIRETNANTCTELINFGTQTSNCYICFKPTPTSCICNECERSIDASQSMRNHNDFYLYT